MKYQNRSIKRNIYRACKLLGLFRVARVFTRRALRIVCYHGFALSDENQFCPGLFMEVERFDSRMCYLERHGYPVLPLERACDLLARNELPRNTVVITIDDGFYGTLKLAQPVLSKHSFPATVYVTSYYSRKETPVFRLAVQYIFWKARPTDIDLTGLGLPDSVIRNRAENQADRDRLMWEIIQFGESELEEPRRCQLAAGLANRAGVDYARIARDRIMSLMNSREIAEIANSGVDVQLHTHRHRLPEEKGLAQREIIDNRGYLEPIVGKKLNHLCYPSGLWKREHWPWLDELGIQTATTCDIGLNYKSTPRLGLKRFMDDDNIDPIEFEAEVSGFAELLRRGRELITASLNNRR